MDNLPAKSSFSIKNGIWFVFNDGQDWIRYWGSNINGAEKFFFNNDLIAECRNLTKFIVEHEYTKADGTHYLIAINLKRKKRTCTLSKNSVIIKQLKLTRNEKVKKPRFKRLVIYLIILVIGITAPYLFDLPTYTPLIGLIIGLAVYLPIFFNGEPSLIVEDTTNVLV